MLPVCLRTLILLVGAPQPRYTGGFKPGQETGVQGPLATTYPRATQLSQHILDASVPSAAHRSRAWLQRLKGSPCP